MPRLLSALALLLAGTAAARAEDDVSRLAAEARAAATSGWHEDARLVEIEVGGYGYVPDPAAMTLRSDHKPKLVMFYFYSPAAPEDLLRASAHTNLSGQQQELLRQHPELAKLRLEAMPGARPMAPYTLPIPDGITDVTDAVALAERSGPERDCAGANPAYGCAVLSRAELHVYLVGDGRSLPVWRIGFGQDAHAKEIVRLVNAATGRLITNCAVPDGGAAPGSPGTVRLACR